MAYRKVYPRSRWRCDGCERPVAGMRKRDELTVCYYRSGFVGGGRNSRYCEECARERGLTAKEGEDDATGAE